jgi:hypothetical protein
MAVISHAKKHQLSSKVIKAERHVRLYHWMLRSSAWRSLSANARAIYIEMALRYAGPSTNNGRLPYSIREAANSLRIGKSTAARAIAELQDRAFIVPAKPGAFSLKVRHATEWRLTAYPCDVTNALVGTKDFMRWQPPTNTATPSIATPTNAIQSPVGRAHASSRASKLAHPPW